MIIALSGLPGAGKSTVAQDLADSLGWPSYDMGHLRRQAARAFGLTLTEYNRLGETDPSTDRAVDDQVRSLGQTGDNFIITSRTAWYLLPQSVKIFLAVEPQVGAQRILLALAADPFHRNEDHGLDNLASVIASNQVRLASDRLRYQQYLGIDVYGETNYDLVLDTTNLTQMEVSQELLKFIASKI